MKKITGILLTFMMLVNLIPAAFASSDAYTIDEVYFSNLSGGVMENPGTSCVVNVKVTKQAERIGEDVIVIATYATDGSMIGFTTVAGTMTNGKTETFSTLVVSPSGKNIGVVKAYMWNNISEMKPVSGVSQTIVNEMEEGIELPPIDEEPIKELYIPKTVTVMGTIVETPKSSAAMNGREYMLENVYLPLNFDNIYTAEEYDMYLKRMNAIGNYYGIQSEGSSGAYPMNIHVVSDLDLSEYLFASGEFTLRFNDKKEYEVVSFEEDPTATGSLTFTTKDYVKQSMLSTDNRFSMTNRLRFGNRYYNMSYNGVELYVNGMMYIWLRNGDAYADNTLDTFLSNAQGNIKLVKLGGDDGYSKIFVDYYAVAEVDSVEYKNGQTMVLMTPAANNIANVATLVISDDAVAEGDVDISVKRNDKAVQLKDLQVGDVMAFATDMVLASGRYMTDPAFINILATDKAVTGVVDDENLDDESYTVDGITYKCVNYAIVGLTVGCKYDIKLDPFGRIFKCHEARIFNEGSRFAVVTRVKGLATFDDKDAYEVEVLADGEITSLYFYDAPTTLATGDAFFFELDSDGFVKMIGNDATAANVTAIYEVYSHGTTPIFTPLSGVPAMAGKYQPGNWDAANGSSEGWTFELFDDGSAIQLVYGVVAEVDGNDVTLAPIPFSGAAIDINFDVSSVGATLGGNTYALTDDAQVYVYDTGDDMSIREYDKLSTGSVIASNFSMFETAMGSKIYAATANGENRDDYTNYALAMIVDGDIVEIYTINK